LNGVLVFLEKNNLFYIYLTDDFYFFYRVRLGEKKKKLSFVNFFHNSHFYYHFSYEKTAAPNGLAVLGLRTNGSGTDSGTGTGSGSGGGSGIDDAPVVVGGESLLADANISVSELVDANDLGIKMLRASIYGILHAFSMQIFFVFLMLYDFKRTGGPKMPCGYTFSLGASAPGMRAFFSIFSPLFLIKKVVKRTI
jgi:hypothetical protein